MKEAAMLALRSSSSRSPRGAKTVRSLLRRAGIFSCRGSQPFTSQVTSPHGLRVLRFPEAPITDAAPMPAPDLDPYQAVREALVAAGVPADTAASMTPETLVAIFAAYTAQGPAGK